MQQTDTGHYSVKAGEQVTLSRRHDGAGRLGFGRLRLRILREHVAGPQRQQRRCADRPKPHEGKKSIG